MSGQDVVYQCTESHYLAFPWSTMARAKVENKISLNASVSHHANQLWNIETDLLRKFINYGQAIADKSCM